MICITLTIHSNELCAQVFEVYSNDTINRKDVSGKKTGKWITFSKENGNPAYKENSIIEEGYYSLGLKSGIWKKYYPEGSIKQELTFNNGIPEGEAKFYYPNGKLQEHGIWKTIKWTGEYRYYFEDGQLSYLWNYNSAGKREGKQLYYYSNGNIMISGEWKDGQESGIVMEYYDDGSLMSEKSVENGIVNVSSIKKYEKGIIPGNLSAMDTKKTEKKLNPDIEDGLKKTYNSVGLIERDGVFKNNIFLEGKSYLYDGSGKLIKTINFKDGKKISEE